MWSDRICSRITKVLGSNPTQVTCLWTCFPKYLIAACIINRPSSIVLWIMFLLIIKFASGIMNIICFHPYTMCKQIYVFTALHTFPKLIKAVLMFKKKNSSTHFTGRLCWDRIFAGNHSRKTLNRRQQCRTKPWHGEPSRGHHPR